MPILDVPGVYIDEVTSPGVIAGVGTSTAAFIGPALAGPLNLPSRISSFDEFISQFGDTSVPSSPYITTPTRYLAHGVRSFFENGGRQAYIVRVGTGSAAIWEIKNSKPETAFRLQAKSEGTAANSTKVEVQAASVTGASGKLLAQITPATVTNISGTDITLDDASGLRIGDVITKRATPEVLANRAVITNIVGNVVSLGNAIPGLAATDKVQIASIDISQTKFRMADATGISPGTIAQIKGVDMANAPQTDPVVVQNVDKSGFVTLAASPARANVYNLGAATVPALVSKEFRLIITPPLPATPEAFDNLSLSSTHPGYVFSRVNSALVNVLPPAVPTTATGTQNTVPAVTITVPTTAGVNDDPGSVSLNHFQKGLNTLIDIEDVNIVAAPDAAAIDAVSIQQALRDHCVDKKDRFAVLDSQLGSPPSGPGSVEELRNQLQADRGFAALYYPWLTVKDPLSTKLIPDNMLIPPSGAIAGIYARTDSERGVHKAPANTDIRGVVGLERILSDGQQGPLNLEGINCLRIFPGTAQAVVWGARTTGDKNINDWIYVNVRRLMIYIEQSIQEGLRWAVFEPNGLPLWQRVKRTLNEFLTRVWQSGALFGATADKAFYVRIDEGNNPPALRAKGELHIEIGVAPVRPAEFVVVTIGLWDGGAQITE